MNFISSVEPYLESSLRAALFEAPLAYERINIAKRRLLVLSIRPALVDAGVSPEENTVVWIHFQGREAKIGLDLASDDEGPVGIDTISCYLARGTVDLELLEDH